MRKRREKGYFIADSFSEGIFWERKKHPISGDLPVSLPLTTSDSIASGALKRRYSTAGEASLTGLEARLNHLSASGELRESTVYFGVEHDPFHPFDGKFETSLRFVRIIERYQPALLFIQTRSPLIVLALPELCRLKKRLIVTVPIESPSENTIARYTPSQPSVEDRLKCIRVLRSKGILVQIQIAPVLPYGDWRNDALTFAKLINEHADYVKVDPLINGTKEDERRLRQTPLARRLIADRQYYWLRPDSALPLETALNKVCAAKLEPITPITEASKQISLFAT